MTTEQRLQKKIERKDLALKACVMWITTELTDALDEVFTIEELQKIHTSTDHPDMQQKRIDEIIRAGLFDE